MRHATLLFAALLLAAPPAAAQPEPELDTTEVSAVEYTRLDEVVFDQASFFSGESAQIAFRLVRLESITSGQTLKGVEVDIQRKDRQTVGGSIGLAALGSMFGGSSSVTYRQIRKSGYIFLRPKDIDQLNNFLDKIVVNLGRPPNEYKIWKLSVQEGFEMGMRYDPSQPQAEGKDKRPRWAFIITAEDASYQLNYSEGYSILQALANWTKTLEG